MTLIHSAGTGIGALLRARERFESPGGIGSLVGNEKLSYEGFSSGRLLLLIPI